MYVDPTKVIILGTLLPTFSGCQLSSADFMYTGHICSSVLEVQLCPVKDPFQNISGTMQSWDVGLVPVAGWFKGKHVPFRLLPV